MRDAAVKKIGILYLILTATISLVLPLVRIIEYPLLYLVVCANALLSAVCIILLLKKIHHITIAVILFFGMVFGTVYLILIKYTFFQYGGTPFIADAVDTLYYHELGLSFNSFTPTEVIQKFLSFDSYYNLGATLYVYLAYLLVKNPLSIDFFNLMICILTAGLLYRFSTLYLDKTLSKLIAIFFLFSPVTLGYAFSHFKESIFTLVFFLVFFFYSYFTHTKKVRYIIFMFSALFVLLYFRPVLVPFFFVAQICWLIRATCINIASGRILLRVLAASMAFGLFFYYSFDYIELYIDRTNLQEGQFAHFSDAPYRGDQNFAKFISFVLAMLGALPVFETTFSSATKFLLSFGIMFNILLAVPFLYGMYRALRTDSRDIQVIVYFIIIHAVSLGLILRGFDPRFTTILKPLHLFVSFFGIAEYHRLHSSTPNVYLFFGYSFLFLLILIYQVL